jgi:hypothetical protein
MQSNTDNIIKFPKPNKNITTKDSEVDVELVTLQTQLIKINHINETLNILLPIIFNNIELGGFDLASNQKIKDINIKDSIMIIESVRSLLYKCYGLYHPFQEISEKVFDENDDVVDSINIIFQKEKMFIDTETTNE